MFIWGCKWKSTSALNRFVFIYNKCVCVSKINYFVHPISFFLFFFMPVFSLWAPLSDLVSQPEREECLCQFFFAPSILNLCRKQAGQAVWGNLTFFNMHGFCDDYCFPFWYRDSRDGTPFVSQS